MPEWINDKISQWINGKMSKWIKGKLSEWINGKIPQWINGKISQDQGKIKVRCQSASMVRYHNGSRVER